jgi:hypothetical protein
MASDIKIIYHNNVFAGSGAPADGDLLTRDNSSHPKDSVYIDRDSGTVYVRKDTTLSASTDWQSGSGGGAVTIGGTYDTNVEAVAALGTGKLYKSSTLINGSPIILITV